MSYIALARKWRPRRFSDVVGQDHVTKALLNALAQQRLHHAYLFTGTRGVGKTSIARLLAKALNCESPLDAEPCLTCESCLAVEQGRHIDLIEIDGASRTRVEDTRELLDNVHYAPTHGPFKIYLIDEVHMLSQHSFNALLKTLEEPPAHVKFLLATTDPQKLPLTILSRCLQFNLKIVDEPHIVQHLQFLLSKEQWLYEQPALKTIARAARGSIRDALSLLDQAIASSQDCLTCDTVNTMLGFTRQDYAIQILSALAEGNPTELITISKSIAEEGGHYRYVLDDLLGYLHQISVHLCLKTTNPLLLPTEAIQDLSQRLTPENVQLFYHIGLKGLDEMSLAPELHMGFEMILLRMYTFKPAEPAVKPILGFEQTPALQTNPTMATPARSGDINNLMDPIVTKEAVATHIMSKPPQDRRIIAQTQEATWDTIVPILSLTGLARNALDQAEFCDKIDNVIRLRVTLRHQSIFTPAVQQRIKQALSIHYKENIVLKIEYGDLVQASPALTHKIRQQQNNQDAHTALQHDPVVQHLKEHLAATFVDDSVMPVTEV